MVLLIIFVEMELLIMFVEMKSLRWLEIANRQPTFHGRRIKIFLKTKKEKDKNLFFMDICFLLLVQKSCYGRVVILSLSYVGGDFTHDMLYLRR
jgi:hypothetical protein